MHNLLAIRVADHVMLKHDAAPACELDRDGLHEEAGFFEAALRPLLDLLLRGFLTGIVHSNIGPVAVGEQNAGNLATLAFRPIEVAADVMARVAGEEDF